MSKHIKITNYFKNFDYTKYILFILLFAVVVIMSFVNEYFFTSTNFFNILKNMALHGICAYGMTLVIISGLIDLSISSTVAMAGICIGLSCTYMGETASSVIIGLVISLILGAIIGFVNTFFIYKFNLPPMIATMSMMYIVYGFCALVTAGFPVTTFPSWYSKIGNGKIWGVVPTAAIFLLVLFIVFYIFLQKSKIGRDIYAVGGNQEAARLTGINVFKTRAFCMIAVQICAVIAGLLLSSQCRAGNFNYAKDWGMTVISAVVIGGTSFDGGLGKITGTFLGLVFITVLNNALTILNVSDNVQFITKGAFMLLAVVLNQLQYNNKSKKVKAQADSSES